MESLSMSCYRIIEEWELVDETSVVTLESFQETKNEGHWYSMLFLSGISDRYQGLTTKNCIRTSTIVQVDVEEDGTIFVKTHSGSIYKLGTPKGSMAMKEFIVVTLHYLNWKNQYPDRYKIIDTVPIHMRWDYWTKLENQEIGLPLCSECGEQGIC